MVQLAAGAAPPHRQEGHSERRPVHRKTKDQKLSQPGATDIKRNRVYGTIHAQHAQHAQPT